MRTYIEVKLEDYSSKKFEIIGSLPISRDKFANLDRYAYINECRVISTNKLVWSEISVFKDYEPKHYKITIIDD